jgi:curved DNA-binding protein CbpA
MKHVNFYDILQVHPRAEPETIQRVYKLFAARYHPDNQRTGDAERFRLIREAYETLIDPERRAEYDKKFDLKQPEPLEVFLNREFSDGIDAEYMVRVGVLCLLYARRRANPDFAALSFLDLENLMAFPREHLSFAIWYLRSKKYILQDDRSSFIITSDGVDFLEIQIRDKKDLYEIFRAAETGLMISTKALLGKHQG